MEIAIFVVLVVIVLMLGMLVIPRWLLKRAVSQVIWIFREYNAVGIKNARTLDELGLRPRGMLDGTFKGRDYKQYALSALMRAEIIQLTEDGRLYLSENKLLASGLGSPAPH